MRVRFGYRRLTALLRREGWRVKAKRINRLYGLENLEVRRNRKEARQAPPGATARSDAVGDQGQRFARVEVELLLTRETTDRRLSAR